MIVLFTFGQRIRAMNLKFWTNFLLMFISCFILLIATLSFIVRDFTEEGLKEKEILLENIVKDVMKDYPRSTYKFEVREQYRNMKQVIDRHPHILEYAIEAIRRAGLRPMRTAIRGGTDGSRLSFMGLPCPNIFAGEHAFHSRLEWVSRQDMEKAVQTIVHLAMIWEEKA